MSETITKLQTAWIEEPMMMTMTTTTAVMVMMVVSGALAFIILCTESRLKLKASSAIVSAVIFL
jgi:hypothetical protein